MQKRGAAITINAAVSKTQCLEHSAKALKTEINVNMNQYQKMFTITF